MFSHPAYPSSSDLSREAAAEDRNVADLVALRELRGIVADAISRAGRIDRIQYPDRRWTTADIPRGAAGRAGEHRRHRRDDPPLPARVGGGCVMPFPNYGTPRQPEPRPLLHDARTGARSRSRRGSA